jgi:hypothetical protein
MTTPDFAVPRTRRSGRSRCAIVPALVVALIVPYATAHGADGRLAQDRPDRDRPTQPRDGPPKGDSGRGRGKGPRPNPRPATLVIASEPGGCVVSVDGVAKGTTNAAGALKLVVPKGSHTITVVRPGYQPATITLDLKPRERRQLPVALRPLAGHLSVSVAPGDAIIRVVGVGTFRGPSIDREVPPGPYVVEVSRAGYRDTSRPVRVGPSERAHLDFALVEVPHRELLDAADDAFQRGNYNRAAEICADVLTRRPNNRRGLHLLGMSLFYLRRYEESADSLARSVREGAEVRFAVMHMHVVRSRVDFCSGELVVRPDAVQFISSSAPDHAFSVPLRTIGAPSYQPTNGFRLAIRIPMPEGRKEKVKDYIFYPPGVRAAGSVPVCHGCAESTFTVFRVLQSLQPY